VAELKHMLDSVNLTEGIRTVHCCYFLKQNYSFPLYCEVLKKFQKYELFCSKSLYFECIYALVLVPLSLDKPINILYILYILSILYFIFYIYCNLIFYIFIVKK
jgi:hypothetical protein